MNDETPEQGTPPDRPIQWADPDPATETPGFRGGPQDAPGGPSGDAPAQPPPPAAKPPYRGTGAPPWALLPEGLRPPRGRLLYFFAFPAAWTDTPDMGAVLPVEDPGMLRAFGQLPGALWRQCIVWPLTIGDQKLAAGRAMGDQNRFSSELAVQAIRAVDGFLADRSGAPTPGNVDLWWERVGERCRRELLAQVTRMHTLTLDERRAFLEHGVAVVSST